jgi:hypothetical protein
MTVDSSTCPYCNANLPANLQPVRGRGLVCPRCQEVLPHSAAAVPGTVQAAAEGFEPSRPRPSSSRVAAYVLSLMFVMAAIGFTFAWYTTSTRRARDRQADQPDSGTIRRVVLAPAALPGLGYIPGDVNIILGLNVAEAAGQEDSLRFLHAVRTLAGVPAGPKLESLLTQLWDQVDHVILGVRVEDQLLPRFTLVIQSLRTIPQESVLSSLKGQRKEHGKRTVYTFPLESVGIDGTLWIADDHTLVITRAPADLDAAPLKLAPGIDRFNSDLQEVFRDSLPAGVLFWLAAATRHGDQVLAPLVQIGALAQADAATLAPLQKLGLWFRVDNKLVMEANADLSNEQAASKFKAYLARHGLATGQVMPALEAKEQWQRLAGQLRQSLELEQKSSHLKLSASCTMDAFLEAVAR